MSEPRSLSGLLLDLVYPVVWGLSVAVYWVFMSPSDVMGHTLIFVYVLNPAAILAVSLLIGAKGARGRQAWAAPLLLGAAYMLLPYVTLSLSNTMHTGNVHVPEIGMALVGAAISAIGLGLGTLIGLRKTGD